MISVDIARTIQNASKNHGLWQALFMGAVESSPNTLELYQSLDSEDVLEEIKMAERLTPPALSQSLFNMITVMLRRNPLTHKLIPFTVFHPTLVLQELSRLGAIEFGKIQIVRKDDQLRISNAVDTPIEYEAGSDPTIDGIYLEVNVHGFYRHWHMTSDELTEAVRYWKSNVLGYFTGITDDVIRELIIFARALKQLSTEPTFDADVREMVERIESYYQHLMSKTPRSNNLEKAISLKRGGYHLSKQRSVLEDLLAEMPEEVNHDVVHVIDNQEQRVNRSCAIDDFFEGWGA